VLDGKQKRPIEVRQESGQWIAELAVSDGGHKATVQIAGDSAGGVVELTLATLRGMGYAVDRFEISSLPERGTGTVPLTTRTRKAQPIRSGQSRPGAPAETAQAQHGTA
jgi:hypothetical protein